MARADPRRTGRPFLRVCAVPARAEALEGFTRRLERPHRHWRERMDELAELYPAAAAAAVSAEAGLFPDMVRLGLGVQVGSVPTGACWSPKSAADTRSIGSEARERKRKRSMPSRLR